ncbi:MAG TPA: beta-L-arabinofuranosidase domain-containing protein [Polyangiaceae bacterium]
MSGLALVLSVSCGSSKDGSSGNTPNGTLPAGGHSSVGGRPTAGGVLGLGGAVVVGGRGGSATTNSTASGGLPARGGTTGIGETPAGGGRTGIGGSQNVGGSLSVGGNSVSSGTSSSGGRTASSGGTLGSAGRENSGGTIGSGGNASGAKAGSASGTSGGSGAATSTLVGLVDAAHVRLSSGSPFYDRQELHRKGYLASWNADKLLYPYRSLAKLPQASGVTSGYAGWDTGFLIGHMTGHYLSATARMAAATGDASFATKANYVVAELAKCQTAIGNNGYLAAFPATVFDWVEGKSTSNDGIVVPYYTVHKIMAGLLDAYHYVGNQQALDVVTKMADYFQTRLAALPAATIEKTFRTDGSGNPQNEFGAMSDVLAELSSVSGKSKYLDTAKIFNRSWFITPLAAGQDNLKGYHGNAHIAEALGIAHTANLSGDSASLQASENFWKLLTGKHAFLNGGDSFHEWLDKPGVEAGASIDGNAVLPPTTAETCNTHNMLKLTSALFERGPRVEYADYYERALYNHILASIAPDNGYMTYFTPFYGNFRTYLTGTFCDNGTGMENTPRFNEGIYFEQGTSLWVNLYIPSVLTWDTTGLTLQQDGNAAAGEQVRCAITKGTDGTQATLNFRIPYWVSGTPEVAVNGVQQTSVNAGTYYSISRQWKVGDAVTLTLPTSVRLEHAQDVSSMVAVFYGPILLAGALGTTNMPNDTIDDKDKNLTVANVAVPTLANSSTNPADWLEAVSGTPLTYKVKNAGAANGITFQPLYQTHHQRYSVYWPH